MDDVVAVGRDGQRMLIGDVIQTRRNDESAGVQNRATWTITDIRADRIALTNVTDSTERRSIPADYAAEHAHLAYASTVHGIQGETVDTSIVGPGADAAGLYVGLTRGRYWNEVIVVAGSAEAAVDELVDAMQRGVPEPTIEDSRRAVRIDLYRAARRPAEPRPAAPVITPAQRLGLSPEICGRMSNCGALVHGNGHSVYICVYWKERAMAEGVDVLRAVERAPLRTVRLKDLDGNTAHPWRVVNQLVERGALARLTHGVYAAPPDGLDGRTWKPPLEPAGLAVAAARFGHRNVALTGIGAARHWAAIPRAIGVTTVAVGGRNYAPVILDAGGIVRFVKRDLKRLELVLERTTLGPGLVTTPAQALYDLLMRPAAGGMPTEATAAAANLAPRVAFPDLATVVEAAGRTNVAVRQMLDRLQEHDVRTQ